MIIMITVDSVNWEMSGSFFETVLSLPVLMATAFVPLLFRYFCSLFFLNSFEFYSQVNDNIHWSTNMSSSSRLWDRFFYYYLDWAIRFKSNKVLYYYYYLAAVVI